MGFAQNHPPVGVSDVNYTNAGVTLNVPAPGLLGNDTDQDGDILHITQFEINGTTYPAGTTLTLNEGTITINADGSYIFIPAAGFSGFFPTITYTVSDGTATSTTTLIIGVEPPGNKLRIRIRSCNQGYTKNGLYKIRYNVEVRNMGVMPTTQIHNIQLFNDLNAVFGIGCITQIDREWMSTSRTRRPGGGFYPRDWDGSSWYATEFDATDSTPGAQGIFLPSEVASNVLYPGQEINFQYCVYVDPACAGGVGAGSGHGVSFDNIITSTSSGGNPTAHLLLQDFHTTETTVAANYYQPTDEPPVNLDGTYDVRDTIIITNDGTATAHNVNFNLGLYNYLEDRDISFQITRVSQISGHPVSLNTAYDGNMNSELLAPGNNLPAGQSIFLEVYVKVAPTANHDWHGLRNPNRSMTQGAADGQNETNPNFKRRSAYVVWSDSQGNHMDRMYETDAPTNIASSEDQCECDWVGMRFLYQIKVSIRKEKIREQPAESGISGNKDVTYRLTAENSPRPTSDVQLHNITLTDNLANICGASHVERVISLRILPIISTATILPNLNPAYNGLTDINIFDGTSGILDPGQQIVVELRVELSDPCRGVNGAGLGGEDPLNNLLESKDETPPIIVLTPIDAVDDDYSTTPINTFEGGYVGDITLNDSLDGVLNPDADITTTILNDGGSHVTLNASTGDISVPRGLVNGTYQIHYQICQTIDPENCDDAIITVVITSDNDRDGIPDHIDIDDDNDGILDIIEHRGHDPFVDMNGNNIYDLFDVTISGFIDTDGNHQDDRYDLDGDGVIDQFDLDWDNDGISDIVEAGGDDSDFDAHVDYPLSGVPTSMNDVNRDGLADEYDSNQGGDDIPNPDTDADSFYDFMDIDSDADGIVDNIEAQTTLGYAPPANADSDHDGLDDTYDQDDEAAFGVGNGTGTAVVPTNTDRADEPDYLDRNSDNDFYDDPIEGWDKDNDGIADTTPDFSDIDDDGLDDAYDNNSVQVFPTNGQVPADFPNLDVPGTFERDWRELIPVPNIITPNNDGSDDEFYIEALLIYPNFKMEIYDRWGSLVYKYENRGSTSPKWWDGTSNVNMLFQKNGQVPEGVYFYIIDFNDGKHKPINGFVQVIR